MSAQMGKTKDDIETQSPDLTIAYLAYALDDVRSLSPAAVHFLEMAITTLIEESRSIPVLPRPSETRVS